MTDWDNVPSLGFVHYDVPLEEAKRVVESWGFVGVKNVAYATREDEDRNCNNLRHAVRQGCDAGNWREFYFRGNWESNYIAMKCRIYTCDYAGYTGPRDRTAVKGWAARED